MNVERPPNRYVMQIAGDAFTKAVKNRETVQQALRAAIDVVHRLLIDENESLTKRIAGLEAANKNMAARLMEKGR